jgi:hypothetical protein
MSKAVKVEKENTVPAKLASIPHTAARPRQKSSSKKHPRPNSDAEDTPLAHNSKRVHLFNLQGFLEEEREHWEEFQERIISQIEKGNEQFAKSIECTKTFQMDFLSLMSRALPPRD